MLASDQAFCFIGLTVCLGVCLVFAFREIEATRQRKQHRKLSRAALSSADSTERTGRSPRRCQLQGRSSSQTSRPHGGGFTLISHLIYLEPYRSLRTLGAYRRSLHVTQRWKVLIVLFIVRLSMAFQFQSVASLSPVIMKVYGVGLGEIGLLISVYLALGIGFAVPGGEIGRRFGDKRVVLFGLVFMIGGGLLMAFAPTWNWQIAGRIGAGIGGAVLNVLMSKMVMDWFAGKEIATAMAIFVNSWPAGIALCLFLLPVIAAARGIVTALLLTAAFSALGFILLAAFYTVPSQAGSAASLPAAAWPRPPRDPSNGGRWNYLGPVQCRSRNGVRFRHCPARRT
jgi:Major Facilitator Superfamily